MMALSISSPARIARCQSGFTYIEMLLTVSITAVVMLALMGVVNTASETGNEVLERTSLTRDARFAMARMIRTVSHSSRLLLPLRDNPNTDWPENLREQTVPASPPLGSSTLASAVLATTLPLYVDLDGDGKADADNDGDGRVDEDLPNDNHNDDKAGIALIDDDGDGDIDESTAGGNPKDDNDEDDSKGEDIANDIDDDGDGSIDEDISDDANKDGMAGVAGVDDDADGLVDEGDKKDDDEDGVKDEDWYDPVVFFLQPGAAGNTVLVERTPVPWDTSGDAMIKGNDFIESEIAANVTRFRVERISTANQVEIIDLRLELTDPRSGESISLQTRVRLGGAL